MQTKIFTHFYTNKMNFKKVFTHVVYTRITKIIVFKIDFLL